MKSNLTYEELKQKVRTLEHEVALGNRAEALRESEQRYRRLVETMGDGLSEIDANGVTTYANRRLCEMWGYRRDEIVGRPVTDFLDEENRRVLRKQLDRRRQGAAKPYEIVWTRSDDSQIHTLMTPTPYFDADGNFMGSFAIVTDISKRKQEQEALRESHSQLQQRLVRHARELELKTRHLEEVNTALKVLLKRREEDKQELEARLLINVRELVMPYLAKLMKGRLNLRQRAFAEVIESTLGNITSPFLKGISTQYLGLTPSEIQVADLVKQGRTTKEISELLSLSVKTIETHRKRIRAKIGIRNKKANLRTYLTGIQ